MLFALTALRFFAATAVVLEHMHYFTGSGTVAVQFFFVLSGFILTYNYGQKFEVLDAKSFSNFLFLRVGRLYPVYLLTFLLSATLLCGSRWPHLGATALNLLMLQSYVPIGDKVFAYNSVSWSVSDEMFFYALFPVIIFVLHRLRMTASCTRLFLLWVFCWAVTAGVTYHYRGQIQPYSFGWWLTYISPQFRFLGFLMGVVAAFVFLRIKDAPVLQESHRAMFTFLELAVLGCVVIFYYAPWYNFAVSPYLPVFSFAVLVFAFGRGMISVACSTPVLIHFGEVSYSIYLLHLIVLACLGRLQKGLISGYQGGAFHNVTQIGVFVVIMCLSNVVYRYCEVPARNLVRSLVKESLNKSLPPSALSKAVVGWRA